MREIRYQLLFEGKVRPEDEMGMRMSIETRAPIDTSRREIDPLFAAGAAEALFESVAAPDQYGRFSEEGRFIFGGGTLSFESEGEGAIGETPDPSLQHGYVVRRIISGTGVFEGAAGYAVSAFTVNEDATMRDSQSAVIFLP